MTLRRKKVLDRTSRLRSSGPIARKRRTKQETERIYGTDAHQDWLRGLPCLGCYRMGTDERPHHLHHVRNGGMGKKANARDQVPLCYACHQELHDHGAATFEANHAPALSWETLREWAKHYAYVWKLEQEKPEHISSILPRVVASLLEQRAEESA